MPKQLTTKRKAEWPHHGPKAMPIKKLQKAFSQPALNSPPRPASTTDLSLSESPSPPSSSPPSSSPPSSSPPSFSPPSFSPPSLTSGSSFEDSSPLTANSSVDKSSASTASIEKSSSAPLTTGATYILQETRPNHSAAQETKEITSEELFAMSKKELKANGRSRGWNIST